MNDSTPKARLESLMFFSGAAFGWLFIALAPSIWRDFLMLKGEKEISGEFCLYPACQLAGPDDLLVRDLSISERKLADDV